MLFKTKVERKAFIVDELKEVLAIVLYLAAALCLLATFKALVLIQLGMNDFLHLYSVAIIEAFVLGKVVAITQKLSITNAFSNRSLVWSALYKSTVMTIILTIANTLEERLFSHSTHPHVIPQLHPLIFLFAHQIYLLAVFFVLYAAKGLNQKLGQGTLVKLLTEDSK